MSTTASSERRSPVTATKIPVQTLLFAFVAIISEGIQPNISNARPPDLDPLFFSWMTVLWELILIVPFYILEQRKRRQGRQALPRNSGISRPRHYWKRLIFIGVAFSASVYLMVIGYAMARSITGIIIVKTSPFFAMLFGAFYLRERITLPQIGFTVVLLVGVYILATKGTFQIGEFSLAVGILLIVPFLWNLAHALTKPLLEQHIMTTPETIMSRMIFCSVILGLVCLITRGTQDFWQWGSPTHVWSMFFMGAVYACLHYTWYKLITTVNLSIATAIMIPTPVVTMVVSFLTASDILQWYHIVSLLTSFVGLYGIIILQTHNQSRNKLH